MVSSDCDWSCPYEYRSPGCRGRQPNKTNWTSFYDVQCVQCGAVSPARLVWTCVHVCARSPTKFRPEKKWLLATCDHPHISPPPRFVYSDLKMAMKKMWVRIHAFGLCQPLPLILFLARMDLSVGRTAPDPPLPRTTTIQKFWTLSDWVGLLELGYPSYPPDDHHLKMFGI